MAPIPFSPPNIGEEEIREVVDTLRSGWVTTGPKVRQFEIEFARAVGAPAALALNSCTAGLHLALIVHGVGPGDVVATTPMTFAATVNVIEHVGATPMLVDVEPDTLNMCPRALERQLDSRVKAIIVVHYAGHPADRGRIGAIARSHGIPLIEDAAHALPASIDGLKVGSTPNLTAFSFYATKNITTGEGGMLTGDADLLEQARVQSLHGLSKDAARRYEAGGSWQYEVLWPGFKYNMTDIQASLGLWQLRKIELLQEQRRRVVELYARELGQIEELTLPTVRPGVSSAWHLYAIRLNLQSLSIGRDEFMVRLGECGIGASVHFIPIHLHPFYRDKYGFAPTDYPVAYEEYRRLISLPLSSGMTEEQAMRVVEAVRSILIAGRG